MFEADITLKVNAPLEKVWNIISNVDNDRNYWREISQIKNLSRERNSVIREVYYSNGDKYHQKIMLFPKEGIHIRWTKGTIIGIKDIMLIDNGSTTIIRVQINYKNGGAIRIGPKDGLRGLQHETENALELIKKDAECKPYDAIVKK